MDCRVKPGNDTEEAEVQTIAAAVSNAFGEPAPTLKSGVGAMTCVGFIHTVEAACGGC
jgi:hypothetical protein